MPNQLLYIVIALSFLFTFLTFVIIYLAIFHNRRKTYFRQELLRTRLEIQEETFHYIGTELHDNVGQIASLIKIQLNTIHVHDAVTVTDKIAEAKELTKRLIADVKQLSLRMDGDSTLKKGLVSAIGEEAERLNRTGLMSARMDYTDLHYVPSGDKAIIIYRMIQEILNNAIKHSKASHLGISLHSTADLFTINITDNGIGFTETEVVAGAGLQNLRNRASLVNGKLTVQSTPGKGTQVFIELPK